MEAFPTVEALAAAGEEEVNARWAGLGFYRRARFLHEGSQQARPQRRHSCRPPPPSSSTTASAQPKPPSEVPRSAPQHTPVLHACVVQVVADFGGVVPTTVDELMSPAPLVRKESARPVPWRGGGSQGREVVQG